MDIYFDGELGFYAKDRRAAERAVAQFRQYYASGQFERMFDMGSAEMKQAMSRAQFAAQGRASAERYGGLRSTTQAAAVCFPHQIRFVYASEFENGPVTELMTWTLHHGKAELLMYQMNDGRQQVSRNPPAACPPAAVD